MKTYLFPGQGSQKKGMGDQLFDEFPELTKKADKLLKYSIKELCLNDPDKKLNQTQYTQPALYVVNALAYQKKIKEGEKLPNYVAGHSLGEYNALQAAGVISFEDGLKLVKKRGELMSKVKNGGMAAIINSSEEEISKILKDAKLTTIDIANLNSPSQIVISGLKEDVAKAQSFFEKANAMFIPLNTSGAFHSQHMKEVETKFKSEVKRVKFLKPEIPIIANITGKPYEVSKMKENLVKQISNCVRWTDSILFLLDKSKGEMEFEELGVGNVLTKLNKKIQEKYESNKKITDTKEPKTKSKSTNKSVPETKTKAQSKSKKTVTVEKIKSETVATNEKPKVKKEANVTTNVLIDPNTLIEQWNKSNSIGTKVQSELYDTELETRTEAMLLFGHRAAVYMKGYNGYFDLRELKAVG